MYVTLHFAKFPFKGNYPYDMLFGGQTRSGTDTIGHVEFVETLLLHGVVQCETCVRRIDMK